MGPAVPPGLTARALHHVWCRQGHAWYAYGPGDRSHWPPDHCPECAEPEVGALKWPISSATPIALPAPCPRPG